MRHASEAGLAEDVEVDAAGYLRRLGVARPGTASLGALVEIHRAHVERIAYNTVDIQLGRPTSIDPGQAAHRVVMTGRGGYCFQLNGGLGALLTALGYQVRAHRGMVWKRPGVRPRHPRVNHLALTVHALPTADNPGGVWLVDVGLGDALHEPVPLRAGEIVQGPFCYRLDRSPVLAGGWRLHHDPAGSFAWVDIEMAAAAPEDFAHSHALLSTAPTSTFVQWISVQRRDATGVDKLVSTTLRRVGAAATAPQVLTSEREWLAVLADVFLLRLDDVETEARAELWRRARTAQETWEQSL